MPSKTLLAEQDELLCEVIEQYEQAGDRPQIRVGAQDQSGARVWIWGQVHKELTGKRKPEDFAQLRSNGDLHQARKDKTGTYYAVTAAGLKRGEAIAARANGRAAGSSAKNKLSGPSPVVLKTAPSRLDVLRSLAAETRAALDAVLAVSTVVERHPDNGSGLVVASPHPWTWAALRPEDQRLIGAARRALDSWVEAARGAIQASAAERIHDFDDRLRYLSRIVERSSRSKGPTSPSVAETQRHAHGALDRQLAVVEELPSAQEPAATVLVPDTNALLFNPAIETWNVGNDRITITVLPQVIAELDAKKMDPAIGEKAKGLIRRFKEFDRRGDTLVGVPIVGKTMFREIALDSAFNGAPSWLIKRNGDDRILAGALDLSQRELRSRVVLVTRDRNMQNKARRLAVAYVDADEL